MRDNLLFSKYRGVCVTPQPSTRSGSFSWRQEVTSTSLVAPWIVPYFLSAGPSDGRPVMTFPYSPTGGAPTRRQIPPRYFLIIKTSQLRCRKSTVKWIVSTENSKEKTPKDKGHCLLLQAFYMSRNCRLIYDEKLFLKFFCVFRKTDFDISKLNCPIHWKFDVNYFIWRTTFFF